MIIFTKRKDFFSPFADIFNVFTNLRSKAVDDSITKAVNRNTSSSHRGPIPRRSVKKAIKPDQSDKNLANNHDQRVQL